MGDNLTLDRSAMKNPATAHLRIYVGNLPDLVSPNALYEHFISFGKINGIIINKNFGFIQFENETSAQDAITNMHGSDFMGRSIAVKTAQSNTDKAKREAELAAGAATSENAPADDGTGATEVSEDVYQEDADSYHSDYDKFRGRGRGVRGRGRGMRGVRGRDHYADREWNDHAFDHYHKPLMDYGRLPVTEKNDCEIIVVSKALTDYAEMIEERLKRLGIVVDLMFPNEDVPIGMMLGNIASRGTLYAILVMPDNLKYRSLTLTILHGLPQEHRNIPLEDALKMISRNYEEVRRGGSSGREAVHALLGQLADGKTLTVLQYDKVIQYLQERRQHQMKIEVGEPVKTIEEKGETDLQARILSILNEKKILQKEEETDIANDPTIQSALDNIILKYV